MPLHGFLNLNKPIGITSRDVVDLVARPLKRLKLKVGHAGTLDPLASGVLVVAVGSATRLIENVQRLPKRYRTVARLGARSDTLDADGTIVEASNPPIPAEPEIRAAIAPWVGAVWQTPPQFSALRVQGQRAYDLARAGQAVDLAARLVQIDRIDLVSYSWPRLELEIDCGSGTYIRSIVRDIGDALACGGLIEVLERTRIGPFLIDDALDPRGLNPDSILRALRSEIEVVSESPKITLTDADVTLIRQGRSIPAPAGSASGEVALIGCDGLLLALANVAGGQIQPKKVLAGSGDGDAV
jgi:tRNA pseudouridine55 synthase